MMLSAIMFSSEYLMRIGNGNVSEELYNCVTTLYLRNICT